MAHPWYASLSSDLVRATEKVKNLIVPSPCASCGQEEGFHQGLCEQCDFLVRKSLTYVHIPELSRPLPNAVAAGLYEHELARCILAFKNEGRYDQKRVLATGLARSVEAIARSYQNSRFLLVPVPSSALNTARRGFSPAYELAREASLQLNQQGIDASYLNLITARRTPFSRSGQKDLDVQQRYKRVHHTMQQRWSPTTLLGFHTDIEAVPCIVCDDVITTGASMAETARALGELGAHVIGYASVAAVPRRKTNDKNQNNLS